MPGVTRSRKPMAPKESENIPIKASIAATGKQPPTPMKRPRTSTEDKENSQLLPSKKARVVAFVLLSKPVPGGPKSKGKANADTEKSFTKMKQPKPCMKPPRSSIDIMSMQDCADAQGMPHWDVAGHYRISVGVGLESAKSYDTDGFVLSPYYWGLSEPRQLYAKFGYHKLKGIMRLCPQKSSPKRFDDEEFEQLCDLDQTEKLGPNNANWLMRWRGIETIGRILGPEGAILRKCSSSDEQQTQCRFDRGLDGKLRLAIEMVHHGVTRTLKAVKISDKEPRRISDPGLLQDWSNYALKRPVESL